MTGDFLSWEQAVTWLVEQPEHQQLVRECYYDRPVIGALRRYADSEEWREVARYLPRPPGRALDLGAGNGIVSYALATQGWEVCALEPDPSDLVGAGAIRGIAGEEGLPIEVREELGESVPYPDGSFDLVIARQVLHHARGLGQMVRELARVLKPGGTLIALRDHVIDSEAGLRTFLDHHPLHGLYGGESAFRLREYRGAIEGAGLTIREELQQFDSVINYAPKTREDLCRALAAPLRLGVLQDLGSRLLRRRWVFDPLMRLASKLYRKPGRLVSFVCRKPVEQGGR